MPASVRRSSCRLALLAVLALAGCGGGDSSTTTGSTGVSSATTFPTGLSVGSPSDLATGSQTLALAPRDGWRFARDWARHAVAAVRDGDLAKLGRLAESLVPLGDAVADPGDPKLADDAELIESVLTGGSGTSLATLLDLASLFGGAGQNAQCYGPSVQYANHDDAGMGSSSGTLPTGDLGIWLDTVTGGEPCIAAQMRMRVGSVRRQTLQGLLLMAAMRRSVAASSTLSMPAAGASTDITSDFGTVLSAAASPSTVNVEAATIALDSGGTIYTYRLVLNNGSTGLSYRRGEVIMRHTPGGSASAYSGTMQVTGFLLSNDAAFGCSDQMDTGHYKVAFVNTLRYSRSGSSVRFGSRASHYCGHTSNDSLTDYGAQVASFTADNELDPSVKLMGNTRGSTLGWRGNFTRFAGTFDRDTVEGSFLLAWQAGTGDSHSRALAVVSDYDSSTGDRSLTGFFAFADEIASTTGTLLGMICNWAGPGNSHTPSTLFQSQTATKVAAASAYSVGASQIAYAPTVNCNSTTTSFDANADNTLASGEGVGVTHSLDSPTGGRTTVASEVAFRGFTVPTLF